jgi:hypothetical protein
MLTKCVGHLAGLAVTGLLLLATAHGVRAQGGDFSFGDDLIGTLPVVYPDVPQDGMSSAPQSVGEAGAKSLEASFTMLGTAEEIDRLVIDATGSGWVEVEDTEDPLQHVYVFHGAVSLELDRERLEDGPVVLCLRPAKGDLGGHASVAWRGKAVSTFQLNQAEYLLPFGRLSELGILDQATVKLMIQSRDWTQSFLDVNTYGDKAFLSQLSY